MSKTELCNRQAKVHLALLLSNSFWGIGAVVGAVGMSTTHPLAFLALRQALAGLLLWIGARMTATTSKTTTATSTTTSNIMTTTTSNNNKPGTRQGGLDWGKLSFFVQNYGKTFALVGLSLFGSQFGFLIGITLAGPVTASVWQPSQPVFMAFLCVIFGWEPFIWKRMAGVAMAFVGCIIMVLVSPHNDTDDGVGDGGSGGSSSSLSSASTLFWIGNFLFLVNCICDPTYVLVSKKLLDVFPPLMVTAVSYFVSAIYMALATLLSLFLVSGNNAIAVEDTHNPLWVWSHGSLLPPMDAMPAMVWFVCFSSAGAYGLINWANQYATGTLVMSYTVLQPVSAVLLTVLLLALSAVRDCTDVAAAAAAAKNASSGICLTPPNLGTFGGMLGVGLGLSLIVLTEPKSDGKAKKEDDHTLPIHEVPI